MMELLANGDLFYDPARELLAVGSHVDELEPTFRAVLEDPQRAAVGRPFLVVLQGASVGLTIHLQNERTIIGRSPQCDLALSDKVASREHALITRRAAPEGSTEYFISDLASTNGTFLNESRLASEQPLRHGDKIRIGSHLLKFALLSDSDHSLSSSELADASQVSPAPAKDHARGEIVFDRFRISPDVDVLYEGSDVVPLEPQAVRVLRYLAANHDRVVKKEELLEAVWPDVFTTDGVLKRAVSQARRALGDDAEQARFIETHHGRGYRFIAPVNLNA